MFNRRPDDLLRPPPEEPDGQAPSRSQDSMQDVLELKTDLLSRYADYEAMDDYPLIATALDIYADDATQIDSVTGATAWVEAKDKRVEQEINAMLVQTRMEDNIWGLTRSLGKYGSEYRGLTLSREKGLVGIKHLPAGTMRRVEDANEELLGFIQATDPRKADALVRKLRGAGFKDSIHLDMEKRTSGDEMIFEDWEVVHMRLIGKNLSSKYGHAVTDPARYIFRRLTLLEDSTLLYRLSRSPSRYVFYVDVGEMPPKQAMRYLNKVKDQLKKKKFVNPNTGRLDMSTNPLGSDEDFFVPVRKGREGMRIDTISGPSFQSMEDVEYFLDKLFGALKVARTYMGAEENIGSGRALSQTDVRFARTVMRLQRPVRNGIADMAAVHLAVRGIDPAKVEFNIRMTIPSYVFELAQMEVLQARADLASRMEAFTSLNWIQKNVFRLNDDDIKTIWDERTAESEIIGKMDGLRELAAQKAAQPAGAPAGGAEAGMAPQAVAADVQPLLRGAARRGQGFSLDRMLHDQTPGADAEASRQLKQVLQGDPRLRMRIGRMEALLREIRMAQRHAPR